MEILLRLSILINKKLREQFKSLAARKGTTMTAMIIEFIKSELKKDGE